MKTNITTLLLLSLLVPSSLALAAEATVTVSADLGKHEAPPAVTYVHQKATKAAIAENAGKLFEKLNQHVQAGWDMGLLAGADKGKRFRVDTPDKQFYALGEESLGFVYSKNLAPHLQLSDPQSAGTAKRLPDAARSIELAREYLAKLELLPADPAEMYVSKVRVIRAASCGPAGCLPQVADKLRVVFFGRKLNGLPVHGASRIAVRIGNDGELVGVIKNWPALTPVAVGGTGVLPKAQWKDAAIRTVKRLQAGSAYPNASIESTELVMYDDGRGHIEPALRAKGKKLDGRGNEEPGNWLVPLLTTPKARFAETMIASEADSVSPQE